MSLIPKPDPAWVRKIIADAEQGKRWGFVCYDSRCNHAPPPHPLLADCPWLGKAPSDFGFQP
jgi:hypothetical protein